ncbi:hypothetical protein LCL89_09345 [Halobacillus yeomjeoni]|uniref:hypothetical protein n=1 Tax=Halobacillus yeomjeoni TaxID=311194 RepID=UPI001CD1D1E1|nr:hypothetical protein [Halobacillus yeomjeoni]MCA0984248.1 hypothetical protein [Halobacillus yeomjeoni]
MNYNNKPFNDVIAHQQHIEGSPKTGRGRLPLFIRIIGYFLFGSFLLMMVVGVIALFLFN